MYIFIIKPGTKLACPCQTVLKEISGPGCSKLMGWLVNVPLKFQTLISNICEYFLLNKLLSFVQQKLSVHLVIKS